VVLGVSMDLLLGTCAFFVAMQSDEKRRKIQRKERKARRIQIECPPTKRIYLRIILASQPEERGGGRKRAQKDGD